jgi:UMF1 family MFS transporter
VGFSGANIFYDSFLTDVARKEEMDLLSSRGYGWGYIGSVIPFLAVVLLIFLDPDKGPEGSPSLLSYRRIFWITGFWWLLFSLPLLKNAKQVHCIEPGPHPLKQSFVRLIRTFRNIRKQRQVFVFLLAYFFYIDGVDTIIRMAFAYGLDLGLSGTMLILVILMVQVVAFPSALIFGRLAKRFSARRMILFGIGLYVLITLISFFLSVISSLLIRKIIFWMVAFLAATSLGGIQALSRSLFGKMIPRENSAEFFGFYNMFGKFAAVGGPFLMGLITHLTGHSRYGILSILILFAAGGGLLLRVRER